MATSKKIVTAEVKQTYDDMQPSVFSAEPNEAIEYEPNSEIQFLETLLGTIVSGSWHGPAADIIKGRLALLKK